MFTGLIESLGAVANYRPFDGGAVIRIEHRLAGEPVEVGESVAVDGVCLTVARRAAGWFEADLSQETLAMTNLADAAPARRVNLERALVAGDRLGGHMVQGHVEATGVWEEAWAAGEGYDARIRAPDGVMPYLVPKGSVAVDGISLTVARLDGPLFEVALIPHTWEVTNLADRRPGDRVNLESDMIVRAVVQTIQQIAGDGDRPGSTRSAAARAPPRKPSRIDNGPAAPDFPGPTGRTAGADMPFCTVEEALKDVAEGRMVIVLDDEDRENEGDLTMAADAVTPEAVNFMARFGRGLICLPMTGERLAELGIPLMVEHNDARFGTAFCVSVEARHGVSTGISAHDRAATIRAAVDPKTQPRDLVRPGHVFPLRARRGGVLRRAGQTEAAVDLARMAGRYPAGVICEIMNDDGSMARVPDLTGFAERHGLKMLTIADLITYRMQHERLVSSVAAPELPTEHGRFRVHAYENQVDNQTHVALVMGEIDPAEPTLVRVHSECLTGDVFGSVRCDCGRQLDMAMAGIAREGRGVVLYLRQEGRGIGLANKLRAYELQDEGQDTVEANVSLGFGADQREYGIGAQILHDLGVRKLRIMTNNPRKFVALRGYGLEFIERVPLEAAPHEANRAYLRAKKDKLGHLLESV